MDFVTQLFAYIYVAIIAFFGILAQVGSLIWEHPLSLIVGMVPAIVWIFFWLREDRANPEPKKRILWAFIGGVACTFIASPLESFVYHHVAGNYNSLPHFFLWATIEEGLKFLACYIVALRTRDDDEPIDAVIYMIITALGFSAMENSLFLLSPDFINNSLGLFISGNLRFVGATLLHILGSSIVGIFVAFSFYKPRIHKKINVIIGLFLAIIVHTTFNVAVISKSTGVVLLTFSLVWWGIMGIIVMIEKVKILKPS